MAAERAYRYDPDRDQPLKPEVVRDPIDPLLRRLAWLMDNAIGAGRFRVGLDGILGLIPGFGDVASGLISAYIIMRATQDGVPRAAVARMMANVAIDTVLGSVPVLGDLFDFAWKSNAKNLRIYEESMAGMRESGKRDIGFVAAVVGGVIVLLAIPVVLLVLLVLALVG